VLFELKSEGDMEADRLAEIRRRLAAVEERLEHLEREPSPGGPSVDLSPLSETERRIATLVAVGRTNEEVGERLFLSPKTVEWSLTKIYRKLRVRSRTELAAFLAAGASIRGNSREIPGESVSRSGPKAEDEGEPS
jgi:LuxR family maltose regulon positive regulatory protein